MTNAHTSALQSKHAKLETQIHQESQRPVPDTTLLAQLKKQKLRIKDELAR